MELEVKMRKTFLFFAAALFVFAVMTPALSPGSFTAAAAPLAVADDPQTPPPPPPQGVSPADPSIQAPDLEHACGCCCCCRAMGGAHMGREKGRFGRPALAPDEKGAEAGMPHRGMMHQKATCPEMTNRGMMREGMAPQGKDCGGFHGRGPGEGLAAERMLRHAEALKLSDEQADKLQTLVYETRKELVDFHAEVEKEQLEVHNLLLSGSDDMVRIRSHLEAISKARADIQAARIANLFEAKKVLTDKQKNLIKEKFPRLGMILE